MNNEIISNYKTKGFDENMGPRLLKLVTDNKNRYIYALGETKILLFRYKYTKSELIDELVENYNLIHKKETHEKKPPFVIVLEKQLDLALENKESFN